MTWWKPKRPERGHGHGIAEECADFLAGRADSRWSEVPVWLPLSWLAHGDMGTLRGLARLETFTERWQAGLAYLAIEILSVTGDEGELRRLQRGALVPLELDLLGRRVPAPRTLGELVELVLATVRSFHHLPQ